MKTLPFAKAATLAVAICFWSSLSWAGGVVTNATEANLRAAMSGGGTVSFACDGTITLASTITNTVNTVLDASGHQITISGGNAVRVFCVQSNVTFAMNHLTIADGRSTDAGAGILNQGTVNATNTTFYSNQALAAPSWPVGGSVAGGAVASSGVINIVNCAFTSNSAVGGAGSVGSDFGGGNGVGGAIWNSGVLTGSGCTFTNNAALGGNGGAGGGPGGNGGSGGDGSGGALFNSGVVRLVNCTLAFNTGFGGSAGNGGPGHRAPNFNVPGGAGGSGGAGKGGALYNAGTARVVSVTFAFNSGSGAKAGDGGGGGESQYGQAFDGGNGGIGRPGVGALFNSGDAELINSTFDFNSGVAGQGGSGGAGGDGFLGGNGGSGGGGGSAFGAIFDQGSCRLINCTIASSAGSSGSGGVGGAAGYGTYHNGNPGVGGPAGSSAGGIGTTDSQMLNTLLAVNTPGNCSGVITDLGHNLSSDSSCAFTGPGSLNNTDPKIGPLAYNSGPTLTMALLPGSPAIDAGDTSAAPFSDQRGFPRPAGSAADMGAFEYGSTIPTLKIARSGSTSLEIVVTGNSNQWCRLLASSNFTDWVPIATNQINSDGANVFYDTRLPGPACRFYRVVMP